jgi:transposase-like protein
MRNKEKIIQEYLTSPSGYRELAKKYGISRSAIHRWVLKFQGIQCASVEGWRKKKPYLTEMVKPTVKAVETTDENCYAKN